MARRLLAGGWDVDLTGRNEPRLAVEGARFISSDRTDANDVRAVIGEGADLLVDNVCYTADQARLVLPLLDRVGSTVMLSSKAVYVDADGNHTNSDVRPDFGGPIRETQPTMAPSDADYTTREGYGANKVAAEQVFLDERPPGDRDPPVEGARPGFVPPAGVGLRQARPRPAARGPPRAPRRRCRPSDRRRQHRGADRGRRCEARAPDRQLRRPGHAERARDLSRGRASSRPRLGRGARRRRLGRAAIPGTRARPSSWTWRAAAELGYVPTGDYAATVAEEIDWLVAERPRLDDEFFDELFDYAAEDRYLDSIGRPTTSASRSPGSTDS